MDTEEIIQHVIDFIKPRYYKELDEPDDDDVHFIAILTECAEYVLNKYKEKEKGNENARLPI